ncbi:hypothetical protein [Sphingopyxis sp. JAI128]|uniref:hypothetical protein n=1 Tax=Sphingopyxis sp. JAI128 TaxID=2723066 RepID=UPI00160B2E6E|nr:hypothetical protein [Sphingopyxis sp. JAI128]MBB6428051.1 hypothetical protein [Sphingopyxis sp. JAI128]
MAAELTIAWLCNPNTRASADEAAAVLKAIHASVSELAGKCKARAPSIFLRMYRQSRSAFR